MVLLAAPAESLGLFAGFWFLLCCLYCVHWCPLLCFLESPFGHWVFELVFKTLLEMCPQAHNPSFLAWSQSPNCSTSQADSSRPEASSASGVIPRRSLLNMIWTCTLYPSGFLFFRGGWRVLRIEWWRVLASWFLIHLHPFCWGDLGIWASILSILTHFPHRVSNRQPLTTQVVTINVHPPAWRFPWWLSRSGSWGFQKKWINWDSSAQSPGKIKSDRFFMVGDSFNLSCHSYGNHCHAAIFMGYCCW